MSLKTRWGNWLWMLALVTGITLLPTHYAYAYLDPGSGSFLLQALVAGFLGFLFALRLLRHRISAFFRRLIGRQLTETNLESDIEE